LDRTCSFSGPAAFRPRTLFWVTCRSKRARAFLASSIGCVSRTIEAHPNTTTFPSQNKTTQGPTPNARVERILTARSHGAAKKRAGGHPQRRCAASSQAIERRAQPSCENSTEQSPECAGDVRHAQEPLHQEHRTKDQASGRLPCIPDGQWRHPVPVLPALRHLCKSSRNRGSSCSCNEMGLMSLSWQPFNAFLAGFGVCVGMFVLTGKATAVPSRSIQPC
jgi:hypothetical protein